MLLDAATIGAAMTVLSGAIVIYSQIAAAWWLRHVLVAGPPVHLPVITAYT